MLTNYKSTKVKISLNEYTKKVFKYSKILLFALLLSVFLFSFYIIHINCVFCSLFYREIQTTFRHFLNLKLTNQHESSSEHSIDIQSRKYLSFKYRLNMNEYKQDRKTKLIQYCSINRIFNLKF